MAAAPCGGPVMNVMTGTIEPSLIRQATMSRTSQKRPLRSIELVLEIAAIDGDVDSRDAFAGHHAFEDFLADVRQERVGQDGVDHAAAALQLCAAADDR